MRLTILHNAVQAGDAIEDQDVLVQVEAVEAALQSLGHQATPLGCTLDLGVMLKGLSELRSDLVFNLVEGLAGCDALCHLAPAVLDSMHVPYTGNTADATFLTAHKLLAKQRLQFAGLPTPGWLVSDAHFAQPLLPEGSGQWILKGVWEQASRDLDEDSVVAGDEASIRRRLHDRAQRLRRPAYAEQFIAGREFNVALLDGPAGPEALDPAEIDFSAFPPGKPRIVGYRAKWQTDSFEYQNTPRRFNSAPEEQPLLRRLRELALQCWDSFGLRGYARVDFRVDAQGQPWILEVNTNPCLSPDAGFAAALERAGIPFAAAIERIVRASV